MEKLTLKYHAMSKALDTLQEILETIDISVDCKIDAKFMIFMRDAIIKRFEYCIDSFWKFLKIYLEEVQKFGMTASSPREILRLSLESGIITKIEYKTLIDAISDRNLSSHTYNENIANEIREHIPLYFLTMKTIIERLKIK